MTSPRPEIVRPTLRRIVQIVLVTISSTAALVSVLSFAKDNLGAAGGKPVAFIASRSVAWVRTTPVADTASAVGDTVRFAATVADKNGSTLNTAPVLWTTSDAAVATVDAHGQAVARAAGTATITATAGEHVAQSRVVVRQVVASVIVAIPGDSVARLGEGDARALAVRAADRRGYVVSGRRVTWRSADSAIALVDSTGRLEGRTVGRTLVIASVEGSAAEVPVEVRAVPAVLERVAPTEEGALIAPAGRALPQRVTVRVLSRRGEPARDVPVRFAVADDGKVEPAVARTSADGVAATTWMLGGRPGRQRLVAAVEGLDSTLVVVAEADPVPSGTRWVTLSEGLVGRVGEPLAQRVAVRMVDPEGRALADVPLAWTAEAGGSIANADARTDSLGEARASWTMGKVTGRQRLRVQAGSARAVPPHLVAAVAGAGPPARAILAGGAGQAARVGTALPKPLRVRVTDVAGNAVAGARVMVLAASGSVADSVVATDSSGMATVRWTLGRMAGQQQLLARPEGVEPALAITAMARPRPAADVEAIAASPTASPGKPVKVRVVVRDEFGNAVPDARVQLATEAGAGSVSPHAAVSGVDGEAAATWTPGRTPGEQRLTVRVVGTKVATTLAATVGGSPVASVRAASLRTTPAALAPTPVSKAVTKPPTPVAKPVAKATTRTATKAKPVPAKPTTKAAKARPAAKPAAKSSKTATRSAASARPPSRRPVTGSR
jgi:hypothetical protein